MNLLICTTIDGQESRFQYKFRTEPRDEPEYACIDVCPIEDAFDQYFSFRFTFVGDTQLQVTMMTTNERAIYAGKGIPEALIHEAALLFNRTVISGTGEGTSPGTENGEEVWKGLTDKGLAVRVEAPGSGYRYTRYQPVYKPDPGHENYDDEQMELVQSYIDMPLTELRQIKPVWAEEPAPEQYEHIDVPYGALTVKVDFGELRTGNLFDYLTGDARYAMSGPNRVLIELYHLLVNKIKDQIFLSEQALESLQLLPDFYSGMISSLVNRTPTLTVDFHFQTARIFYDLALCT